MHFAQNNIFTPHGWMESIKPFENLEKKGKQNKKNIMIKKNLDSPTVVYVYVTHSNWLCLFLIEIICDCVYLWTATCVFSTLKFLSNTLICFSAQ